MKFLVGIGLGIVLCAVFPTVPKEFKTWINTTAQNIVELTDPSFTESAQDALTDWRSQ